MSTTIDYLYKARREMATSYEDRIQREHRNLLVFSFVSGSLATGVMFLLVTLAP